MAEFLLIVALQICLDRAGFSPSAIDGGWGHKSQVALATYCAAKGLPEPTTPRAARETLFAAEKDPFTYVEVTPADVAALVTIPPKVADKATLRSMGYETLLEAFAERGHLSQRALKRLNPTLPWPNPPVGSRVKLPDFSCLNSEPRGNAASLRVSLSRLEVTAFDAKGDIIGLFPCSIAANKNKLPPPGEIHVKGIAPHPNYTYTPDNVPQGAKVSRHILPPGPNNPVGSSWIGLSLPGYGIHGTPSPETIGRAESHGCFRLANWNAVRLRRMCNEGVPVVIER